MNNTFKIYGKVITIWKHMEERNGREIEVITQKEIEYTEYDLDGNIISVGTEDFSRERYKNEILEYFVYTWDGKKLTKAAIDGLILKVLLNSQNVTEKTSKSI